MIRYQCLCGHVTEDHLGHGKDDCAKCHCLAMTPAQTLTGKYTSDKTSYGTAVFIPKKRRAFKPVLSEV